MRCFDVLVHGRIHWLDAGHSDAAPCASRPAGLYCHRYVLASNADHAQEKAIHRVRENLEHQTGWMSEGRAWVEFIVEEVASAPLFNGFLTDNRGHTFYAGE